MTSLLSIWHRLTGIWLGIGSVFLVWWLIALAAGPQPFAVADGFFASWIGRVLLVGWSFAFWFHLTNGLRHLFWDLGLGYRLDTAYASGWAVLAASLLLSLVSWAAAYTVLGP